MMTRGNRGADWDPMRDDFVNSSYEQQYPDREAGEGVQLDHTKLYITNLPKALSEEGLKTAFAKFGTIEHSFLSKDPNKKFGIIKFETAAEARIAMMKLNRTEPLQLNVNFAHKKKPTKGSDEDRNQRGRGREDRRRNTDRTRQDRSSDMANQKDANTSAAGCRDRSQSGSVASRDIKFRDDISNGDIVDDLPLDGLEFNRDIQIKVETIRLEHLKIQEKQLLQQQRLLLLHHGQQVNGGESAKRTVQNLTVSLNNDKYEPGDSGNTTGAGDSNETTCSCQKSWTKHEDSDEGSSTPSTCVLCSEERSVLTQSKRNSTGKSEISKNTNFNTTEYSKKGVDSKATNVTATKSNYTKRSGCSKVTDAVSKQSDVTSKKVQVRRCACNARSDVTCDLKLQYFYNDTDDEGDETNRLIQLRNSDYLDIVDDQLKVIIALAGYPKSKMRLRQMEMFQRCLTDIINMQINADLLKKVPSFLDYYLNRGAIVCICKDLETRDWMVRISPGLQERMHTNLVLLNAKVKRLCLAVLKIPRDCWPATAQDCFKLLQYFNPSLKTDTWKIYAQKMVNEVECTSFLIDRVSGEIIRGPYFKNVIDYEQIEFELTGYTEIYYECLLSGIEGDLSSVASRVKLLEELKSAEATPRIASTVSLKLIDSDKAAEIQTVPKNTSMGVGSDNSINEKPDDQVDAMKDLRDNLDDEILKKIKDVTYVDEEKEVLVWAEETNYKVEHAIEDNDKQIDLEENCTTTTSFAAISEKSESIIESNDNLLIKASSINIDSNRGIAYHRRTNYLHVNNELKVAITLEGYPLNKLEGTHIRRLKHLFKEYLHKDMKSQRFANLIIPKFQDIYLSNGAVIYICDSMETRDYLNEVLPKFINATGLKLMFRDIKNLVRYTRIVMRLSKEKAHVESVEILAKLQEKYPALKPDCWKYYSDVAGKQKRQFGVDPVSLDVIKSPDFDPVFEGEKLIFRVIDRQKRDVSCEESNKKDAVEDAETVQQRQAIIKFLYAPIDQQIVNAPLTRIRTNHYSDLIADDFKLYVGPVNYPDTRIDETQFHSVKRSFENVFVESYQNGEFYDSTPVIHDMYLFDGVIFVICQNMESRIWIENTVEKVNRNLKICLKSTEFRGAVGIISMVVKTGKNTDDVISVLQNQNPRLRTKYWRKISTVKSNTKLDVVLQIDKLSAQVIIDPNFNNLVESEPVQFKLGHLQSLIKPKASLEELTKAHIQKLEKKLKKTKVPKKKKKSKIEEIFIDNKDNEEAAEKCEESDKDESPKLKRDQTQKEHKVSDSDLDPVIIQAESPKADKEFVVPEMNYEFKMILKIPINILPDNEDDLNIIFDILEDKNPGLNTEIWQVYTETTYPSNGKFILYVDKQSATVIKSREFDSTVGGEKLMFYF